MKSGATPRRFNYPLCAYGSMAWVSFSFLIIGNEECFRFTHLTLELRYTPSLNVLVLRRHVLLSAHLAAHLLFSRLSSSLAVRPDASTVHSKHCGVWYYRTRRCDSQKHRNGNGRCLLVSATTGAYPGTCADAARRNSPTTGPECVCGGALSE